MRMMSYKWLILLLLAKSGESTTPAAVGAPVAVVRAVGTATVVAKPAITKDDIVELLDGINETFLDDWAEIVDSRASKSYDLWMEALKEPGKGNENWFNYYLMNRAIKAKYFKQAVTFLEAIISAPYNQSVIQRIKGGTNKEYQTVLDILYEATSHKRYKGRKLAAFEGFKKKLADNVYIGADKLIYDKYASAIQKTEFTDEEWKFAESNQHVYLVKIMISQFRKSKMNINEILLKQRLYIKSYNISMIKMLIETKVPMIFNLGTVPYVNVRNCYYGQVDQKLRADILDLIYLHNFGDDKKLMNMAIPEYKNMTMLALIKDSTLNEKVPALLMNPKIGEYKSDWIVQAIKYANNMAVLKDLLEERVPLPDAATLSQAIASRKETTKTAKEFNDLIDSYRKFYDPATGLCIEGPKFCKKRKKINSDEDEESHVEIKKKIPKSKFKAYTVKGKLTASVSKHSECRPFEEDYEGEVVSFVPMVVNPDESDDEVSDDDDDDDN